MRSHEYRTRRAGKAQGKGRASYSRKGGLFSEVVGT